MKLSDRTKTIPQAKHILHKYDVGVSALALTRLLTLVQVGVCRRYALEAIINVIDYLPVHN